MTNVEVGPWGGKGGENPWRYQPAGKITEIRVKSGSCVDSIRFTYTDDDKKTHHSETYGGDGGSAYTFTIGDGEYLIGISGTVGTYSDIIVITSISFQTNKKSCSYGTDGGTSFSLPVFKGQFVGFSGNYGDVLDSFGVILTPP